MTPDGMCRWIFIKKRKIPFDVGYKAPVGTKSLIPEPASSLFKGGRRHDVSPGVFNLVEKRKKTMMRGKKIEG